MPHEPLALHSELVPATGMIDGDATRRALGKPDLGFWEVFLRESLQNSWDARVGESIDFSIDAVTLEGPAIAALREGIFSELPPSPGELLGTHLANGQLSALVVRDGGTRGLSGPARADIAVDARTRTDFRNLVFDIGRDPRRVLGGGTYGFGKGILYDASRVRTCVVYSRTATDGEVQDRLIATSVSSGFAYQGRRYTGRHWWGLVESDVVSPLEGESAVELARSLGMLTRDGRAGTVIAVLDPIDPTSAGDQDLGDIMLSVRDAALKWAWPHLADPSGTPSIRFSFTRDGNELAVSLDDDPELQQFASAYREALKFRDDPDTSVTWQVQPHRIPLDRSLPQTGVLAVRRALQAESIGTRLNNTVALMRAPRFVVKYERIDPDPQGQYTAGVFIVDDDMEQTFAKSEPVTHDAWAREHGRSRSRPIGVTLTDIRVATTTRIAPPDPESSTPSLGGMAHLSRTLGENLMGFTGKGAERQPVRKPGGLRTRSDISVRLDGDPSPVEMQGNRIVVDFPLHVRTRPGADLARWTISAAPKIVAEAGSSESGAEVATAASIIGWRIGSDLLVEGAQVNGVTIASDTAFLRIAHEQQIAVTAGIGKERHP